MVAMDFPSAAEAESTIAALKDTGCFIKVGLELFYAEGPRFVAHLKEQGYQVFLDVKMHDIPNTVKGAASRVTRLGVDMFNVHAAGGRAMLEAAMEGVDMASSTAHRPTVIGVTQLTSTSMKVMNEEIGILGTVEETVLRYAGLCHEAGLRGVVSSPHEVPGIKQMCGTSFLTVTPGIRLQGSDHGDQQRVTTPQEAFANGSDYIVIGRPITKAKDPREAWETILNSLEEL